MNIFKHSNSLLLVSQLAFIYCSTCPPFTSTEALRRSRRWLISHSPRLSLCARIGLPLFKQLSDKVVQSRPFHPLPGKSLISLRSR